MAEPAGKVVLTPPPQRPTQQDKAHEIIDEYQKKLDEQPDSDDAPALLFAMGNLYRQKLMDHRKAAGCYEQYIRLYPDTTNIGMVYTQLSACYEALGDGVAMNHLHVEMLQRFPEGSQEYLFAKDKLSR